MYTPSFGACAKATIGYTAKSTARIRRICFPMAASSLGMDGRCERPDPARVSQPRQDLLGATDAAEPSTRQALWERRRRYTASGRMLECIGKLEKAWLAACSSRKGDAEWREFGVEPLGKRRCGCIRNQSEWDGYAGIPRLCGDSGSGRA